MNAGAQLTALADPTRRAVFELLTRRPLPVGEIAAALPVSRPAVSQHLKVLADAGLVRATAAGTRRIYAADPAGLRGLRQWVDAHWDTVMDRFEQAAREDTR